MKILFLLFSFPSLSEGIGLRHFHLLRCLSNRHNIALVSFKDATDQGDFTSELEEYCNVIRSVPLLIPKRLLSFQMTQAITHTIKNMFSHQNVFSRTPNLFDFYYSPRMQRELRELLRAENFDAIYAHSFMASYIANTDLPKVIDFIDANSHYYYQMYKLQRNPLIKMYFLFRYLAIKNYEKRLYKAFDASIVISFFDKAILESYLPGSNLLVVPNGVDIDYFTQTYIREDFPSLVFVGNMQNPHNVSAILYFCNKIYPSIQQKVPNIKLYIVGRDPPREACQLASDESIVVTGYVEDIRPYLARASVALAPMISGTGVKNKILEAMAVGKPVVSTSIGAQGIDASPGENIIIADEPTAFADWVVELLSSTELRQELAHSGRKLVEAKYSWGRMADMLNEILEQAVRRHNPRF